MQSMHSPALIALAGMMGHTDSIYNESFHQRNAALSEEGRDALRSGIHTCLVLAVSCLAALALIVEVAPA